MPRYVAVLATLMPAALFAAPAAAQSSGGYRLLIETGIDDIAVRELVAGRMGRPSAVERVSKAEAGDPAALARVTQSMAGGDTLVVACPSIVAALDGKLGRPNRAPRGLATEIGRVLPAEQLAVVRF